MWEESVPNLIQPPDLEARVAILRKRAEQMEVTLPTNVAFYIAQNVRSNERALELAVIRLIVFSSMNGTEITLASTQRMLKSSIDAQAHKVTPSPLQELPSLQFETKEAKLNGIRLQGIAISFSAC